MAWNIPMAAVTDQAKKIKGAIPQTIGAGTAYALGAQPMSAQSANKTPGVIPAMGAGVAPQGSTLANGMAASMANAGATKTQGAIPNAIPAPGSQESARAWINDARSGQGGMDAYTAKQQEKYNAALASGNQDMLNRLSADMARVGYTLTAPKQPEVTIQSYGAIPQAVSDPVTSVQTAQHLQQQSGDSLAIERAALKNAIDERMNAIRNASGYSNQLLNDKRVLEDQQLSRTLNPYSGRTGYTKAMIGRGRDIDDSARAADITNQLNSVQQEMYNFDKLAPERQREIYNKLLQMERDFGLNVGQLTGNYAGGRTLAGQQFDHGVDMDYADRTGTLNGQRTLAGQQFDRGVYESDRNYDYQVGRDKVSDSQWTQQFNEDKRRYGEQFAYQQARDKIADAQDKREFDERVRQAGLDNAVQWYNAKTSRQNSSLNQQQFNWSKDPNNPDNIYRSAQIDALKKEMDGTSGAMKSELEGLYTGLSSNQISPTQATSEVESRLRMGLITNDDATKMKSFIQKYMEGNGGVSGSIGKPQVPTGNLDGLSGEQLLKAWETDPTGKAAGRAKYDWRSWITDPRGYKSGLTYEMWKSQYGPTLGG